jgi:hypothetical protein
MTLITRQADSTEPWLIPGTFKQKPNGVCYYADGEFAWPRGYVEQFPRRFGISVRHAAPEAAEYARALDIEREDATAADAVPFLQHRRDLGHDDGEIYCDRSTVPAVVQFLHESDEPEPFWWIATLDNIAWTPAGPNNNLTAWLKQVYGVTISPERVRAIQCFPMGAYDVSLAYGAQGWDRP